MDSHLLVVSGVSSCWRSGCSEAEMNPGKEIATRYITSRLFSDGYYNKDNWQILRTHYTHSIISTYNSKLTLIYTRSLPTSYSSSTSLWQDSCSAGPLINLKQINFSQPFISISIFILSWNCYVPYAFCIRDVTSSLFSARRPTARGEPRSRNLG